MDKIKISTRLVIIIVVSLILLSNVPNSNNIILVTNPFRINMSDLKTHSLTPLQEPLIESTQLTFDFMQANDINRLKFAVQSSGTIFEDSEDFLEGTMENVKLDDQGCLSLDAVDDWINLEGVRPSARYGPSMVYASKSQKVILFGGSSGGDETWVFDPLTNAWTKMDPPTHPSARRRHAMAYNNQSDKVILFGGSTGGAETWVYDLATNTWTNMNPSPSPSARQDHMIVYDSMFDQVILFGGNAGGSNYLSDTWVYNLTTNTWTNKNPSSRPSARKDFAMAYDSTSEKVILFGGYDGAYQGDTWVYDPLANTWTNKNPSSRPSVRWGQAMTYDSDSDRTILFGGFYGLRLSDTWAYNLATNAWTNMNPSTNPGARDWHTMVYDPQTKKVLLFGGRGGGDDTWGYVYSTNTWNKLDPSTPPSARYGHAMVYDAQSTKTIVFGGSSGGSETWSYDLLNNSWTNLLPSVSPVARFHHSMVYDSQSHMLVLFGGTNGGNETWRFDFPTNAWTDMNPSTSPSARYGHAMVYDEYSDQIILFGGFNLSDSSPLTDTWRYHLLTNTWTELYPSVSPGARFHHSMVYNPQFSNVFLFGGENGSSTFNDTWVYDQITNTWTQLTPSSPPSPRYGHSMVYDPFSDKILLFGGSSGGDETWFFDLLTTTWTQSYPSVNPGARYHHTLVYNSYFEKFILFGGSSGGAETWGYPKRDDYYQKQGIFESQLTSLSNIYSISGECTWNPVIQPTGTVLKIQVGFSNTSSGADFHYSDSYTSYFSFGGLAQYMRYRVIFESDVNQLASPLLKYVTIYYSLETPRPTVHIITPQNDSRVEGMVTISVLVDSPNDIDKVYFYIGGLLHTIDYSPPFNCTWNSTTSENGYITLLVAAVSMLGRENSESIQLLVDNPVELVPTISAPSPPLGLSAIVGDNFVELSWSAPSDDSGSAIMSYRVYRGTTSGEYQFVGITTTTSFNDTLVLGDITYYYVVTAINAIGESAFSNEASATPTGATIPRSGSFPSALFIFIFLGIVVVVTRKTKKR